MINDFLIRYKNDLIDKTTKKVKQEIKEEITSQVRENVENLLQKI